MRNFWDQTGSDWTEGTLIGKPTAMITGRNTQYGGQETTITSTTLPLLDLGYVLMG